ncbi:MAG TPA: ferrous iron transport protein B [Flavobacteriales bacterium]|nr:ferrous iron transport protein B [Flavobacteriales bacterium]
MNVALIGNPNSGKTSVFNRLTGLNQQVGNFPGITVDKKTGDYKLPDGNKAKITDLPGVYSLYPNTTDERIVLEVLLDPDSGLRPDLILYVADASNLERHLVLLSQIMDLGFPVVLLLNMVDLVEKSRECNDVQLANMLQIPVIKVNGRTGVGIKEIGEVIVRMEEKSHEKFLEVRDYSATTIDQVKDIYQIDNDYHALLIAHNYQKLRFLEVEEKEKIGRLLENSEFKSIGLQFEEIMARYERLHEVVSSLVDEIVVDGDTPTAKADRILTHPIWGSLIFLATLFLIFQAIFAWASYPMDWIDSGVAQLSDYLHHNLPRNLFTDFLIEGLLAGIGGIVIFIPQITILFLLVAILEETGYMSRAVFLSDNIMRRFGLNGRSIVSLISGVACAVPAVMSTRTISNTKERLITIFVTPFISCSARIPVFAILVAFAVPADSSLGFFNLQGIVLMGLYTMGVIAALGSSWVLHRIVKSESKSLLMMELPSYSKPYWKNVGITAYEKVKVFVMSAGKIILVISILLWFLASFGPVEKMAQVESDTRFELAELRLSEEEIENRIAAKKIEHSYAGILGKTIEPVIRPLGFDWKIGIALITSFAAREVFVSTMATIYSVGSSQNEQTLKQRMSREVFFDDGEKVYSKATAFSLLVFYVLAMQCISTLAIVKRETNSWAIPIVQLVYMTGLAYILSLITYQLLS